MKLLHSSDWHFGMSLGVHSLLEEQRFFVQELITIIKKNHIDGVIVAGDIYDSSVANSQAIGLYNDAVTKICKELKVPMFIIAGNHDGAARLSSCNELLAASGLYIAGKLEKKITPYSLGDVDIYMIPYINIDEVRAIYPDEQISSYEEAMECLMNHIREVMDKSRKNIVVSHAFVVGAQLSDSDRSAKVGTATAVSKDVFREFDYVALGHIHRPQILGEHIRYSGSPLVYSFGKEEQQEKRVILIDTDTQEEKDILLHPQHTLRTIEGTYSDILQLENSEDYIHCHITDRYIGIETVTTIKEKFPRLIEISGKDFEENQVKATVTLEEMSELSKEDMVQSFFNDIYNYSMSKEQCELVHDAFEQCEEEGEWQ